MPAKIHVIDPSLTLDVMVLRNHSIKSAGQSSIYYIGAAKHVDVLIRVGSPTGTPSITFHLQVIDINSGQVIRTYDGSTLSAEGSDWITVDGLTLGTHIRITWDGTLDASNYFDNVFCRVIAKR